MNKEKVKEILIRFCHNTGKMVMPDSPNMLHAIKEICDLEPQETQKVVCPECNGSGVKINQTKAEKYAYWYRPEFFNECCSTCHGTGKVPQSSPEEKAGLLYHKVKFPEGLLLTDEYKLWLDGKCTCGMCPENIAYAYHETSPDKWISKGMLCLYHNTHGNEGLVYVPIKTAVRQLFEAKAQLAQCQQHYETKDRNRVITITELKKYVDKQETKIKELEAEIKRLEIIESNANNMDRFGRW